jgi:hypothetical protein
MTHLKHIILCVLSVVWPYPLVLIEQLKQRSHLLYSHKGGKNTVLAMYVHHDQANQNNVPYTKNYTQLCTMKINNKITKHIEHFELLEVVRVSMLEVSSENWEHDQ